MDTPELDKVAASRQAGSQEIGEFVDWLVAVKGVTLHRAQQVSHWERCSRCKGSGTLLEPVTESAGDRAIKFVAMPGEECVDCAGLGETEVGDGEKVLPWPVSTQDLLVEYFGVDLQEVEREKRALLDEMRKTHETT